MLVLSRKQGEALLIGKDVEVTVVRIRGRHVVLAIAAPQSVLIMRAELEDRDSDRENKAS